MPQLAAACGQAGLPFAGRMRLSCEAGKSLPGDWGDTPSIPAGRTVMAKVEGADGSEAEALSV